METKSIQKENGVLTLEKGMQIKGIAINDYSLTPYFDLEQPSLNKLPIKKGNEIYGMFEKEVNFTSEKLVNLMGKKLYVIQLEDGQYVNLPIKHFEIEIVPPKPEIKVVGFIDLSKFEKKHKILVSEPNQEKRPRIHVKKENKTKSDWKEVKFEDPQNKQLNTIGKKFNNFTREPLNNFTKKSEVKSFDPTGFPTEIIHFFKDREKKVVGRMGNGKIAIIDFNYKGTFVQDNEDWKVAITQTFDKKVIVYPLALVTTAEENAIMVETSMESLKDKDWNKASGRSFSPINKKNTYKKFSNRD